MKINCVIEALLNTAIFNIKYLETYFINKPFLEESWGPLLEAYGFKKILVNPIPNKKRLTMEELASSLKPTDIVVARCACHIATIRANKIFDNKQLHNLCVYHYYIKLM